MGDSIVRTKTYIAFDGDIDLMSCRTVQSWDRDNSDFSLNDAHNVNYARDDSLPESIKNQLIERLNLSKNLALLIGSETKKNKKGILEYGLNYALRNGLPIFLFFKGYDADIKESDMLWKKLYPSIPTVIANVEKKYCLIRPFTKNIFASAAKRYSNNNLPTFRYNW